MIQLVSASFTEFHDTIRITIRGSVYRDTIRIAIRYTDMICLSSLRNNNDVRTAILYNLFQEYMGVIAAYLVDLDSDILFDAA